MKDLNRRVIYLFVFLALAVPMVQRYTVTPSRMVSAERMYEVVQNLKFEAGDVAFISLDFGPNTIAENRPQAEVTIEHLMRRRVPIVLFSQYIQADPFLKSIPEATAARLSKEFPGETWRYGQDWVNLGYRPNSDLLIQGLPKAENIAEYFKQDAFGTPLNQIPAFKPIRGFKNFKLLGQFTGLTGTFATFVQFFQTEDFRPTFVHGCTSITTPEAYIYLDSGQLSGLLEGLAGAAWYSKLLSDKFSKRSPDDALLINTGLGIAQLILILLIVLGNLQLLFRSWRRV